MIRAIIVAEGEVGRDLLTFESKNEYTAFAKGFSKGASLYAGCARIVMDTEIGYESPEVQQQVRKLFGFITNVHMDGTTGYTG